MRVIRLLIDGYNVLFQSQLVGRGRGQGWLPRARQRLLQRIAQSLAVEHQARTTVVFDAVRFGETPADFLFNELIDVRFAKDYAEADDLLEVLIRRAPQPKLLHVVSSDLRIRRCAIARRAVPIEAEHFLQQLAVGQASNWFAPQAGRTPTDGQPLPDSGEGTEKSQGASDVDYCFENSISDSPPQPASISLHRWEHMAEQSN